MTHERVRLFPAPKHFFIRRLTAKLDLQYSDAMNWRLTFSGLQSAAWTTTAVIAAIAAAVLCVFLMKYERRLVSRGTGMLLLGLRMLVLLTLLLTLLQPVLTRTWDTDSRGRLLVAVDVSESMETADRQASRAEMLRWAQALGMLGNDATDALIESWIAAFEEGRQPDWGASTNGNAAVDGTLADARREHINGIFEELRRMPRVEFVRRLLQSRPNDLLETLQHEQPVDLRAFAVEQQAVTGDQLQPLLDSDRSSLVPGGTDIVSVLTSAVTEDSGGRVNGIVMFTDGRQTKLNAPEMEASRLGTLGIPLYSVPVGSMYPPHDISIASIDAPQSVFLDDTAQVRSTIAAAGMSGRQLTVRLERDGVAIDQRLMTVTGDQVHVDFSIPSQEVGQHEFAIATDVQEGELREDNNSRSFVVSVVDNRTRVLLVEGDARWEFRYLKNALERDKRVELSTVLFSQPYIQMLNSTFLPGQLPPPPELAEQLSNTDILLMGDVNPQRISEAVWQEIESAVAEDGMTLVVVPGRRDMPHNFSSAILNRLLPVRSFRQQTAEEIRPTLPDAPQSAFYLRTTPLADELAMFQMTPEGAGIAPVAFSQLPGPPWVYMATPAAAATVWAEAMIDGGRTAREDSAAIIHQYYGFGQVVWMGIDSTWRWRRRAGDTWHHRFWGQLVRWAARNKSAAGNDQVRMTLSEVLIDETEHIDVSVRWNPNVADQLQDAQLQALIVPLDAAGNAVTDEANAAAVREERRVTLAPVEGSPERFAGRISRLPAGAYEVRLQVESDRLKLTEDIRTQIMVQRQLSTELADISCNRDLLQSLATLSGGRMLEPWQLSELPDLLRPNDVTESAVQEKSLWDHWLLLVVFFALLMTEWVVRKLSGLP
ncbi:MAG: hypothetical protein R3C19_10250 [Planctomycetaceae bacterium]